MAPPDLIGRGRLGVRIGDAPAVPRITAGNAVLAEGRRVLINVPVRFDGVRSSAGTGIAGDTPCRDAKFVTVITDLTPIRDDGGTPHAVAVMDPFRGVRLAGDTMVECRRRVEHAIEGTPAAWASRSPSPAAHRNRRRPCTSKSNATGPGPCSKTGDSAWG